MLWILSWEQVPAHCSLGLVLLAHSVPCRVEVGPGTWARPAQVGTHSTQHAALPGSVPPDAHTGIHQEGQSGGPLGFSGSPGRRSSRMLCSLQLLSKHSTLGGQMLPWWACFRSPI